jgi:hypothetical protein
MPGSEPTASRGSSAIQSKYASVGTDVATLGVWLPASRQMASRVPKLFHTKSCVDFGTAGAVTTLGVFAKIVSHDTPSSLFACSISYIGVIGLATILVGFPVSCPMVSRRSSFLIQNLVSSSGRQASRHTASGCTQRTVWNPGVSLRFFFGILCRRWDDGNCGTRHRIVSVLIRVHGVKSR